MAEALLELASSGPAAGIDFTAFLQPDLGETDHYPAEQAQGKGRLGVVDPALIFPQRHVQGVMQATFDHPVTPLEFEKADGVQFFQSQAADEISDFGGLFTFAPAPAPQPDEGLNAGKTHLLWAGILAIDHPTFVSSPVDLPGHGVGGRGGRRGKTLFGEPRRESFKETLLVLFDQQQEIATLLIKYLLDRRHLPEHQSATGADSAKVQ